jgi:hypothetical protein
MVWEAPLLAHERTVSAALVTVLPCTALPVLPCPATYRHHRGWAGRCQRAGAVRHAPGPGALCQRAGRGERHVGQPMPIHASTLWHYRIPALHAMSACVPLAFRAKLACCAR